LVAAVSLYLLLPTLLSVFGSWRSLSHLEWYFAVPVFASEGVSAVHSGDAAQGRGRHRRGGGGLLGVDRPAARDHGGTALLALPAIIGGTPVSHSLVAAAYLGVGVLLVLVATGTAAFASDRPLDLAGRGIQWLLNTTVRRRHPVVRLPRGLLADRDFIPTTPGGRWKAGVATAAANTGFDYLALLFALRAVGPIRDRHWSCSPPPPPSCWRCCRSRLTRCGLWSSLPNGVQAARQRTAWLARFEAGVGEQPAQVDDHLSVDVLVVWRPEDLGLAAELDLDLAVGLLGGRSDGRQQRQHLAPLDVAAQRVAEDLLERVTMVVGEVRCHEASSSGLRRHRLPAWARPPR
jgi:hypothetical protein